MCVLNTLLPRAVAPCCRSLPHSIRGAYSTWDSSLEGLVGVPQGASAASHTFMGLLPRLRGRFSNISPQDGITGRTGSFPCGSTKFFSRTATEPPPGGSPFLLILTSSCYCPAFQLLPARGEESGAAFRRTAIRSPALPGISSHVPRSLSGSLSVRCRDRCRRLEDRRSRFIL